MTDEFELSEAEIEAAAIALCGYQLPGTEPWFDKSDMVKNVFRGEARAALRAAARVRRTDVAISDLCADEIAEAYARGRRDEKEAAAKVRSESNG